MRVELWVATGIAVLVVGRIGAEVLGNAITVARSRKALRPGLEDCPTPELKARITRHAYFDLTATGGSLPDTQAATDFFAMIEANRYSEIAGRLIPGCPAFRRRKRRAGYQCRAR